VTETNAKIIYSLLWGLVFPEKRKVILHKYNISDKRKAVTRRYAQSERGKQTITAYNNSSQGKNNRRRAKRKYKRSEKGRLKNCVHAAKRNALKRCRTVGDLFAIEKVYARAQELRQWFDVVVDHIVPLAKGGAHSPENLQIIYAFENERKGARLDYKPRVIFK
jgi:5-methylcytosine-specific restriction endonuclease McrA